jgi:hypothetical protein
MVPSFTAAQLVFVATTVPVSAVPLETTILETVPVQPVALVKVAV